MHVIIMYTIRTRVTIINKLFHDCLAIKVEERQPILKQLLEPSTGASVHLPCRDSYGSTEQHRIV